MNQRSDRDPLEELAEEFVARYRSGEHPAVSEFAQRRPELADEVRAVFPALVLMEDLASSTGGSQTGRATAVPDSETPPEQLGDYRIIREIGRGGMGVVYEAEQLRLQRRVALKVLPHSMLRSENSRKRFLREARSAARLHHTNIVPVFGVGEEQGMHYYAMQFIEGRGLDRVLQELGDPAGKGCHGLPPGLVRPSQTGRQSQSRFAGRSKSPRDSVSAPADRSIDRDHSSADHSSADHSAVDHSAADKLAGVTETAVGRLSQTEVVLRPGKTTPVTPDGDTAGFNYWNRVAEIGVQVAEAIEHSHAQGILHRDVKPGNLILDAEGTVWLTDFGLARAGDDAENVTATGEMVGTLRYSAPEQIEGEEDCRSDIYSLGVTLYELLALRPAFPERSRNKLAQQIIRGEVPRLRKLDARIPRDLETVVHKAIHREPGDRFQTAAEFAADLRRFLNREPIQSRRVRLSERIWRWCRRNPAITWSVALSSLAITITLAAATVVVGIERNTARDLAAANGKLADKNGKLARKEHTARVQEQKALRGVQLALAREAAQKKEADRHAREAEAVNDFLVLDMIGAAQPDRSQGKDVTVRQMLDRAAKRAGNRFAKQPPQEAAVRHAIGLAYYKLGRHTEAEQQFTTALTLRIRTLGAEHPSTIKTMTSLAANHHKQGHFAPGRKLEERALEIAKRTLGPNHAVTLNALSNLASSLHSLGEYEEARRLFQDALRRKRKFLGPDHRSTLATMSNLAVTLVKLKQYDAAVLLNRQTLKKMRRVYGADHPATLITWGNLALALSKQEKFAEAADLNRRIVKVRGRLLGPQHPQTLTAIHNLAGNLEALGQSGQARQLYQRVYLAMKQAMGPEHPKTLAAVGNLAWAIHQQGENAEARRIYENLVKIARRVLGPNHPLTATFEHNLIRIPHKDPKR